MEWKQERPKWCPHKDCIFIRRTQDAICGGKLKKAMPHLPNPTPVNTDRVCINETQEPDGKKIFDLQLNDNDLDAFRWIFDSIDGRKTSYRSNLINKVDPDKEL